MKENKKLQRIKIIFITFVSVFSVVVFNIIATQSMAAYFNYSPALGEPFNGLYFPFDWIVWTWLYYNYHPNFFHWFLAFLIAGVFICIGIIGSIFLLFKRRLKGHETLHGSAHWATLDEIEKMDVYDNDEGVFIGGYVDDDTLHYLRHNGAEHAICFAPTRSGKGLGIVIPSLLVWKESVLCIDIKKENYALSAGFRKKHLNNRVLYFDPTDTSDLGTKFNPLCEVRLYTDYDVSDCQNIAQTLVGNGQNGHNNKDDYFRLEGKNLLTAIMLHVLYIAHGNLEHTPNLNDVYLALNDAQQPIKVLFQEMMTYTHIDGNTHPIIASIAQSMLNKADAELSGVVGTANAALNLFTDPIIGKNTNKSDFRIIDLMNGDKPMSLYLVIPPSDLKRLEPLFNLFVNMTLKILTSNKLEFESGQAIRSYKHRLLFMADEFPAVGKIDIIEKGIAYIAGYGIKLVLIVQDLKQLYQIYGHQESIISNCHIRIAYTPNTAETAKMISDWAGVRTVVKKQITHSGKLSQVHMSNASITTQEVSRPLITVDEVMRIAGAKKKGNEVIEAGDMLIFIAGQPPIYGKQTLYFKDPILLARSQVSID